MANLKLITTYQELIGIIEKISPNCKGLIKLNHLTWFCAYQFALELEEDGNSTKDIANYFDGNYHGYKDWDDINEWLEDAALNEKELTKLLVEFGYTPDFKYN